MIKALFSIEGERQLLSSIIIEPKEVKAIAKTVADKWHLPEVSSKQICSGLIVPFNPKTVFVSTISL